MQKIQHMLYKTLNIMHWTWYKECCIEWNSNNIIQKNVMYKIQYKERNAYDKMNGMQCLK